MTAIFRSTSPTTGQERDAILNGFVTAPNGETWDELELRIGGAVSDAAAFLDEHVPGWEKRVTRPINMISPHTCILGQVFARPPRKWLGLRKKDPILNGYARGMRFLRQRYWVEHPFVFSSNIGREHWYAEIDRRLAS